MASESCSEDMRGPRGGAVDIVEVAHGGPEGMMAARAAKGRRSMRNVLRLSRALAVLLVVSAWIAHGPAAAQSVDLTRYAGTLKKVRDSGTVVLGYRENSPPFAFLDEARRPVGYSLDLCEVVVEEIGRELGRELRIEYRPVTPENRFDLVRAGTVDLECGSSTNNAERRATIAFSPTIFVTGTKLMVRRGSGIFGLNDLAGKTIVLTRGTV